jgi:hypothetical protein
MSAYQQTLPCHSIFYAEIVRSPGYLMCVCAADHLIQSFLTRASRLVYNSINSDWCHVPAGSVVAERANGIQQTVALMQATIMVVRDRAGVSD